MAFDGLSPEVPMLPAGTIAHRTPFGIVQLPPGSKVAAYVRGTAGVLQEANGDTSFLRSKLRGSIAEGLDQCRSGTGDAVIVLPGHTENAATATWFSANLKAGARVIGLGRGSLMPTITFTAVGSQMLIDKADVEISGLRLGLTGADEITKAINITGAGGIMHGCDIIVATGASNNAAIAIEFGTACDRFEFVKNRVRGSVAGPPTNLMLVAGVSDGLRIADNDIAAAVSAVTVGCINITAAATGLRILRNIIHHRLASSETGISCGAVAAEGVIANNYISVEAGTPVSDTIELNAASLLRCFENYGTDTKNTSGLLTPAVVT